MPPALLGGAVSSVSTSQSKVVLSFDEALDESSAPATGDFGVTTGSSNTTVTVSGVAVEAGNVVLTLGTAISSGTQVVVSYTPGTNPVRDVAGNAAAAFTETMTAAGTGTPMLQSAVVDGVRLTLTYDLPLNPDRVPGPEAFTLHHTLLHGERPEHFIDVTAVGVAGRKSVLHLEHPVFPCAGATPFTVSYEKPPPPRPASGTSTTGRRLLRSRTRR